MSAVLIYYKSSFFAPMGVKNSYQITEYNNGDWYEAVENDVEVGRDKMIKYNLILSVV